MRMRAFLSILTLSSLLLLASLLASSPISAAPEPPYWQRFDVEIEMQTNGDFLVTEDQSVLFAQQSARHGFRIIPLDRVEQIGDVSVSDPSRPYEMKQGQGTSSDGTPFTFQTEQKDGNLRIDWWFPPTSNASRTFTVRYRVVGGLRYYPSGDQLYWKAIYADRPYPIQTARVEVRFPVDLPLEQLKMASYPQELRAQGRLLDPRTIVFEATNLPPDTGLEVRVQYPHGILGGRPPSWQEGADRLDWYMGSVKPVVNLFLGVIGALILILGLLWIFLRWYSRGRDPLVGQVPTTLSEPPSDLPPAVVGTLVDERAGMRDLVAAIVDLARRGLVRIVEEEPLEGSKAKRGFRLEKLGEEPEDLCDHERLLYRYLFAGDRWVRFDDLMTRLRIVVPEINKLLYQDVSRRGFFEENPDTVRKRNIVLGVVMSVIGWSLSFFASPLLFDYAELCFMPFVSLGIVGLVQLLAAWKMPKKTRMGALEAARWKAFGRYLKKHEPKESLSHHLDRFEPYLPYAVALGVDKEWVKKFADAGASTPGWYGWDRYPGYYRGVAWTGDERSSREDREAGDSREGGLSAGEGAPSLQELSNRGAFGLQDLSDGLAEMLNTASRSMASGGGGGGWSGGGSSGGGGGGGGSGGFN